MDNQDKGLLPLGSGNLINHILQRFAQPRQCIISANRNIDIYAKLCAKVLPDHNHQFAGPLTGILEGIKYSQHSYALLCLPCDTPFLPPNLPTRLQQALLEQDADIAVPRTPVQTHPVIMLCRTSILPTLEAYLSSGRRKVSEFQEQVKTVFVDFPDEAAFFNINTPEDLAEAEQRLRTED